MIEITDLKQFSEGACKARFTVKLPKIGMEIRECALFEHNGKKWIGLPSRPYEDQGKKKYYNLVKMEEATKKRFDDKVFALLSEMITKTTIEQAQDMINGNEDLPF